MVFERTVDGMLMEVHRLDIMLIVEPMVKLLMMLVFFIVVSPRILIVIVVIVVIIVVGYSLLRLMMISMEVLLKMLCLMGVISTSMMGILAVCHMVRSIVVILIVLRKNRTIGFLIFVNLFLFRGCLVVLLRSCFVWAGIMMWVGFDDVVRLFTVRLFMLKFLVVALYGFVNDCLVMGGWGMSLFSVNFLMLGDNLVMSFFMVIWGIMVRGRLVMRGGHLRVRLYKSVRCSMGNN